ncbi:MAG: M20/M25/M40 family metallo-hydrolase [Candidatus Acidiferrum sp.]
MKNWSFLFVLSAAMVAQAAGNSTGDATTAAKNIRLEDIRARMFFLSNSDMAGRLVGTPEHQIAANYIESEFMRLGLKPGGDDGTYFQGFDMVSAWPDPQKSDVLEATIGAEQKKFVLGHDFSPWPVEGVRTESVQGPIEFLGYGINAPEYGYDDFAGVELHGKVAMVLEREPQAEDPNSKFRGRWDTYHAYDLYKIEEIRRAGAAAVLIVNPGVKYKEERVPSAPPNYTLPQANYSMAGGLWDIPVFTISRETADFLLSSAGKSVEALQKEIDATLKPDSFEAPGAIVRMEKNFETPRLIKARNVIGILEGSDPELKKQYLIVSGHYDHMGIVSGRIYAGADDNASGVVGTMEIAQAFVEGGVKPKRSLVFVCFDAEEEGLIGSEYYIEHPSVPLADTVANLNMDMIGRDEESLLWNTTGEESRNMVNILGTLYDPDLRKVVEQENDGIGLKLDFKMDARDPGHWFARSDHFWFATRGVPQVFFNTGAQPDYHTENDTWTRINYPKMRKIVQLIFLTAAQVADESGRPKFTP